VATCVQVNPFPVAVGVVAVPLPILLLTARRTSWLGEGVTEAVLKLDAAVVELPVVSFVARTRTLPLNPL